MLTLKSHNYSYKDFFNLHEIVEEAIKRINCPDKNCEKCEYYTTCHDLNELNRYLVKKLEQV